MPVSPNKLFERKVTRVQKVEVCILRVRTRKHVGTGIIARLDIGLTHRISRSIQERKNGSGGSQRKKKVSQNVLVRTEAFLQTRLRVPSARKPFRKASPNSDFSALSTAQQSDTKPSFLSTKALLNTFLTTPVPLAISTMVSSSSAFILAIFLSATASIKAFGSPMFQKIKTRQKTSPSKREGVEIELPDFDELFKRIQQVSPLAKQAIQNNDILDGKKGFEEADANCKIVPVLFLT